MLLRDCRMLLRSRLREGELGLTEVEKLGLGAFWACLVFGRALLALCDLGPAIAKISRTWLN